jgi:anti-sigma B factor antagonist
MGLSIDVRKIDDILIVAANGPFSTGEGTLFRNTVKRYSDDGARNFILNLGEVSYIDSSGFGELLKTYTTLRKIGGEVVLLNPSKMVRDLLEITKLSTVFHIFDDESKAIASLK